MCLNYPVSSRVNLAKELSVLLLNIESGFCSYPYQGYGYDFLSDLKHTLVSNTWSTYHCHSITSENSLSIQHCIVSYIGHNIDNSHNWHRHCNSQGQVPVRQKKLELQTLQLQKKKNSISNRLKLFIFIFYNR